MYPAAFATGDLHSLRQPLAWIHLTKRFALEAVINILNDSEIETPFAGVQHWGGVMIIGSGWHSRTKDKDNFLDELFEMLDDRSRRIG